MNFIELKYGDWFFTPQGALFIRTGVAAAANLMTGDVHFFEPKQPVRRDNDLKLSILFRKNKK